MKTLWTPWRMDHVSGKLDKIEGCLFEPEGEDDPNRLLLYLDSQVVVLLNQFPYANGHLLVAPRRHVPCITDLDEKELSALMLIVQKATTIIKETFSPSGINVGCNIGTSAGAGIADHLHFHIIPRWDGDHNFMTTIAEVRTIPQHIETTYRILYPLFARLK